jgi:ABC-type Fe3+/spermidine/putrescine transport system ATPase subunit
VTASAVGLEGVTKRFGQVEALAEVSLEVERGQFVTLLGPSGCGKTTLLRIVAGLEHVTEGRVLLDGRDVTSVPPQRRDVGFAFQRYALFPHLTVLENVAFGLRVRGAARAARRAKALEMLELVGLAHLSGRLPNEISGGQAQRVALARALAPGPSVLLLDEPLTALDLAVRSAMQEELRRIHRELGTTFVYVTHDQGEALTMSDRIVLMRDGRVVQDSPPFELYRRPDSLFAATFVGEANAWRGRAARAARSGEPCPVEVPGLPTLVGQAGAQVAAGGGAVYVLRPDRIALLSGRDEPPIVEAVVTDVLARGARALVLARAADGLVVRVELAGGEADRLAAGARIALSWPPEEALVFPSPDEGAQSP